jgi:hypothetical protein
MARAGQAEPPAVLARLVAAAPLASIGSFVSMRFASSLCAKDRCVPHAVRQQVLEELRATPLYQVGGWVGGPRGGAKRGQGSERAGGNRVDASARTAPGRSLAVLAAPHRPRHGRLAPSLPSAPHKMVWPLLQADAAAPAPDFAAERLCMLLLLQPPSAWAPPKAWADPAQHAQWQRLLETSAVSILESEAKYLRHQFSHLGEVLAGGDEAHAVEECGTCSPPARGGAAGGAAAAAARDAAALTCGPGLATAGGGGAAGGEPHASGGSGGGCCGGH